MSEKLNIDLPTAAQVANSPSTPETLKQQIARRARAIGSGYERTIAKRICNYFGISRWQDGFFRTQPHGHLQPDGDIRPINDVARIWKAAGLGPIECKKRREWSFEQLLKNVKKSKIFEYWQHSNDQTKSLNSIVIFSKPGAGDYVFYQFNGVKSDQTCMVIQSENTTFIVQTLENFLKAHFLEPLSLM